MSADNLTGQYISDTFRKILQLSDGGSYITDGTGSIVVILPVTSSYAQTASYVPGITATVPGGSLWSLQFKSGSSFEGSNNLSFNKETNFLFLTGSSVITGSATVIGNQTISGSLFFANIPTPTPSNGAIYFDGTNLYLGV